MDRPLRIAQVAPIAAPVNAVTSRSVEHLVYQLTEELVRRGHQVTLFATADSQTSAELDSRYQRGYDYDQELWNWTFHEAMHVAAAFERADDFDIIHSHDYEFALPFTDLVRTPVVHTYHILPNDDIVRAYRRHSRAQVVAISEYQRSCLDGLAGVEVIHHGIDVAAFPFGAEAGDYLLYLGQVIPDKGPKEAICLAHEAGMPLVIAGPVDTSYFDNEIGPLLLGSRTIYVGSVERHERDRLLAGAAALLYPITVPEPFGLVMVEAMACGTPVLALDLGAVSEIVDQGVTGYFADDLPSLLAYLPAALALPRPTVRRVATERFNVQRMAYGYESLYRRVAGRRTRRVS